VSLLLLLLLHCSRKCGIVLVAMRRRRGDLCSSKKKKKFEWMRVCVFVVVWVVMWCVCLFIIIIIIILIIYDKSLMDELGWHHCCDGNEWFSFFVCFVSPRCCAPSFSSWFLSCHSIIVYILY